MKEAIIGGLVLSAVTATCFIAYNHPTKYRQCLPWAGLVAFLIMLMLCCWNGLVGFFMVVAHDAGMPFVVDAKPALDAIQSAYTRLIIPWWGVMICWLYFGFMYSLKLVAALKDAPKPITQSAWVSEPQSRKRSRKK
jgi:hypothetical protein